MGQYTVPQNVEAEDQIIGPLTFKQFVYAMIGFGWGVLVYAAFNKIIILMLVLILPVSGLFLMLAFFRRDGQNFEQLLIAMVGYFGNSRKRIWQKDDSLTTLYIAPKKEAEAAVQRSATEIHGDLERLSQLIDSRGWNQQQTTSQSNELLRQQTAVSDRLVTPQAPTEEEVAAAAEAEPTTDMLDLQNSPLAQNLAGLINQASEDVRREAISQMSPTTRQNDTVMVPVLPKIEAAVITKKEAAEILNKPTEPAPAAVPAPAPVSVPAPVPNLDELMKKVEANLSDIKLPAPAAPEPIPVPAAPEPVVTPKPAEIIKHEPETLQDILGAPLENQLRPEGLIQPGSTVQPTTAPPTANTEVTINPPTDIINK
jgi:hypothetical protein